MITFGWRSQFNGYQVGSAARRMNREYANAPDTHLRAGWHEAFIITSLDTNAVSKKCAEQFRDLKNGDWVSLTLADAEVGVGALSLALGETYKKPICVPSAVGVGEAPALRFKRNRPESEEPVVKKIN